MIFDIENSLWIPKIGTFWRTVSRWRLKFGNFIWLQMIFGQKSCFLGLIQIVAQKVNIHYNIITYCKKENGDPNKFSQIPPDGSEIRSRMQKRAFCIIFLAINQYALDIEFVKDWAMNSEKWLFCICRYSP